MLVGREPQVDTLVSLFTKASSGEKATVLIDGPMGIGKTALLTEVTRRASDTGMRVLTARADRLEQDLGFGVVRQLLERTVLRDPSLLDGPAALAGPLFAPDALMPEEHSGWADTSATVLHGLYWLTVRLTETTPVVFAIDDAQWIDQASLRWLAYLFRRLEGLPVVVLATHRGGMLPTDDQLTLPRFDHRMRLTGLDERAVEQVVHSTLDQPAAEFVASCRTATGGNPLFLTALLSTCRQQALPPDAASATRISEYGPEEVDRLVRDLVHQLGPDGVTVVEAVAVLGDGASPEMIGAVADTAPDVVYDILHRMRRAGLMVGRDDHTVSFTHAVVRAAIADGMLPSVANLMRRRAARTLFDEGADRERIAAYVLRLPVVGEQWVSDVLMDAAMVATKRGAPESVAAYLRRALGEPLARSRRASALIGLGTVELGTDLPTAIANLTEGIHLSAEDDERERSAVLLGRALCVNDRYPEAIGKLQQTRQLIASRDSGLTLPEIEEVFLGTLVPEFATAAWRRCAELRLTGHEGTPVEGLAAAFRGYEQTVRTGSAAEAIRCGRRALELRPCTRSDAVAFGGAALALAAADDVEVGWQFSDQAVKDAVATGSVFTYAVWISHRGQYQYRCGRLLEAQADLQASIDIRIDHLGVGARSSHVAATAGGLLDVLVDRMLVDDAEALLRRWDLGGGLPDHLLFVRVLQARGRLRLVQGDPVRALADFQQAMDMVERCGFSNPFVYPCHYETVTALLTLGRTADARDLAERTATLSDQWGTDHAKGTAFRTRALVEPRGQALELLHESVRRLSGSPSRLDYAHSLADLGALLLRDDQPVPARDRLREALDLAERMGAVALSERVLVELKAAGGRPRSRRVHGTEALTPSERRVASLAATGATNTDIAQQLFVGLRTVEVHLTNTYRKLGIHGRTELACALSASVS
ncbi:helix-turn-helix transcriptional regulator [Allokutzneria oryzae]|uniref:AAA family ATPase n=1 Tax=Allokutzneria oryzae TaxID=1378989 RepID=A0ABV6A7A4_9PSEU